METSKNGLAALFLTALLACAPAHSQQAAPDTGAAGPPDDTGGQSDTDLAKKIQNPIGDLYSFPFQNNTNFRAARRNAGRPQCPAGDPDSPHPGLEHYHSHHPAARLELRTFRPCPACRSARPRRLSRRFSRRIVRRTAGSGCVGPVVQIPTISSADLGSNVWGGGPTAVLVYMNGPWVVGALANNVWSFGGTHGPFGTSYNNFLTQPFVNYNFGGGWYVSSSPIITASWETAGTKWTVPVGAAAGRVFRLGKLPINVQIGAYYNIVKPTYAGDWQLRTQLTLIF